MTLEAKQKKCFVLIGFGKKMDYLRGIEIDLDRTFHKIIKPVFKDLNFECIRAADIDHSGSIDEIIFTNIYNADFVVADISTLNANVLYELGVRHGVKKNTTIIIADSTMDYPFDLSHISIEKYNHGGGYIDVEDADDMKDRLYKKVTSLLTAQRNDSPFYQQLPHLEPPIPKYSRGFKDENSSTEKEESISDYLEAAESYMEAKNYKSAIETLLKARKLNYEVTRVIQKLAEATYKSQLPNPTEAFKEAWKILSELSPDRSYDPETRGLAGAIFKGLFNLTSNPLFLYRSMEHYNAGFAIHENYYNGINIAFLLLRKAIIDESADETRSTYAQLISQRLKVKKICQRIMNSNDWFSITKKNKIWTILTLAEVFVGEGNFEDEKICLEKANLIGVPESILAKYLNQKMQIIQYSEQLNTKLSNMQN